MCFAFLHVAWGASSGGSICSIRSISPSLNPLPGGFVSFYLRTREKDIKHVPQFRGFTQEPGKSMVPVKAWIKLFLIFKTSIPDTPCMPYMPTLTSKTTPIDGHIWQSHGVSGTCFWGSFSPIKPGFIGPTVLWLSGPASKERNEFTTGLSGPWIITQGISEVKRRPWTAQQWRSVDEEALHCHS